LMVLASSLFFVVVDLSLIHICGRTSI